MKQPRLAYQSAHKSFVPSADGLRLHPQPKYETLSSMAHHRLAPCQVRPKQPVKKAALTNTNAMPKRASAAKQVPRAAALAATAKAKKNQVSSTEINQAAASTPVASQREAHNLVEARSFAALQKEDYPKNLVLAQKSNPVPKETHHRRTSWGSIIHHLHFHHHTHHHHGASAA